MSAPPLTIRARRAAERAALDAGHQHGVPGQLNACVLDVDSDVTGYGRHNRLIVFRGIGAEAGTITIREDLRGLPASTEADRQTVARGWQRLHPRGARLAHVESSQPWATPLGESIEHIYRIVPRRSTR